MVVFMKRILRKGCDRKQSYFFVFRVFAGTRVQLPLPVRRPGGFPDVAIGQYQTLPHPRIGGDGIEYAPATFARGVQTSFRSGKARRLILLPGDRKRPPQCQAASKTAIR